MGILLAQTPEQVVLNLWASVPKDHWETLITTHNSGKITVMKWQWRDFMVGGQHNLRNYIKGPQPLEG